MQQLTPNEKDSPGELLNIAMGLAASSLSKISGNEVDMTIPSVELITLNNYKESLGKSAEEQLISISESFSGEAALIFFVDESMDLVRTILGDLDFDGDFTDMEEEVFTEIGNILLNSCISVFSSTLLKEFHTGLPRFNKGSLEKLLPNIADIDDNEKIILLAQIGFSIQKKQIKGQLTLTLSLPAVRSLLHELNVLCGIAV